MPVRARVMVGNDILPIMFLGFIAIQTLTQTEENTYFVNRPKTGQILSLLFLALVLFFYISFGLLEKYYEKYLLAIIRQFEGVVPKLCTVHMVVSCFQHMVVSGFQHIVGSGFQHMVVSGFHLMVVSGFQHMVGSGFQQMVVSGFQHMVESGFQHMVGYGF